jgi:hypothetical protein
VDYSYGWSWSRSLQPWSSCLSTDRSLLVNLFAVFLYFSISSLSFTLIHLSFPTYLFPVMTCFCVGLTEEKERLSKRKDFNIRVVNMRRAGDFGVFAAHLARGGRFRFYQMVPRRKTVADSIQVRRPIAVFFLSCTFGLCYTSTRRLVVFFPFFFPHFFFCCVFKVTSISFSLYSHPGDRFSLALVVPRVGFKRPYRSENPVLSHLPRFLV